MPKHKDQIIGSFVLRDDGDGCLSSKYHHAGSKECPFSEACKLVDPANPDNRNDVFAGKYRTVWLEDGPTYVTAELTIQRNLQNSALFQLRWRTTDGVIFEGSGMLYENLMVGAYWDA